MSFLEKILTEKEKEVERLKGQKFTPKSKKKIPTFKELVQGSEQMSIISEIKRTSPSKGDINLTVNPIQQAKQYESLGASAISVLTDEPFFNGSIDDVTMVREEIDLPILCKDFVVDPVQIDRAKAAGANIILLIVAALEEEQLKELYQYAGSVGLEVLVEVHNEPEMNQALALQPEIIGINNRDLTTFNVDLENTKKLASMVTDPNTILISESGMKTQEDALLAKDAGARAILVGETLMRSKDLEQTFNDLKVNLPAKA